MAVNVSAVQLASPGLIGQITCQLLRAAGCRVAGVDLLTMNRAQRVDYLQRVGVSALVDSWDELAALLQQGRVDVTAGDPGIDLAPFAPDRY